MKFIRNLFDLQLFADLNTNTTGSNTTGNDLSAEMKTFYDMTLIDEAGPQLVHSQFGQKRPIPKGSGKTIEFRKFSPLPKATTALTEGVTPDGGKLNVSTVTATVGQYGYYIVQSDMLELTALDNTILEATQLLGKQAGNTLDTIVRNVLIGCPNVNYCPKISGGAETAVTSRSAMDTTSQLTVDVVQQVVAKLRANNAPTIDGDYAAINHPYVAYDLMRDPEWIDAHKYAQPENLYAGEIGKVAGVRFVQTTEAKVWRDSTCPAQSGATPAYYGVFATLFRRDRGDRRRAADHRQAERIRRHRRSSGSAFVRGLESDRDRRDPRTELHGSRRVLLQAVFRQCERTLTDRGEGRSPPPLCFCRRTSWQLHIKK